MSPTSTTLLQKTEEALVKVEKIAALALFTAMALAIFVKILLKI